MEARERIILAVDVDNEPAALRLIEALGPEVGTFKIGLELFNATGPAVFARARAAGAARIFYDAKLCDIPNTVAGAARAASRHELSLLTLHAFGGLAMMRAAREAAEEAASVVGCARPKLIAITLLTSLDQEAMAGELGLPGTLEEQVVRLARLAGKAGLDGVVASPWEAAAVRAALGPRFLIITPGVRPAGMDRGDQRRVMTAGEAVSAGADYVVVGRAITGAADPRAAARAIAAEIAAASL
jgi:orotidine-5'-phosphate decarboxylase